MKLTEITESSKDPEGTYAGVKFCDDTKKAIKTFMEENEIPNPIESDKMHSTLLYSRNYLPDYKPTGKLDEAWTGEVKHFSIFPNNPKNGGDNTNCLVLEYTCKEQSKRFDELMDAHDATYDFDEYKPHVTLSYSVGDLDHKKLPKFKNPLKIVEEYSENLNLN